VVASLLKPGLPVLEASGITAPSLTGSQLAAMTLDDVLRVYLDWMEQNGRPSAAAYWRVYEKYFANSDLKDRPAESIHRYDILYFKQQYESTPAHCSKGIGLIKQAYNFVRNRIVAAEDGTKRPMYAGNNPAWRVSKHDSMPRERTMDLSEIRCLLASLPHFSPKYRAFFANRMLTPCRIKELCEMRRDAVNLETGKWFKYMTKNGRPQWTYIPTQGVHLLRALPVEGDYFFLGAYGHPLQAESARRVWARIRGSLGMRDLWLLDFRRTLATYLYNEIKADDLTAKAVLNHYDGRPVAVYTRLNYDRLAEIIQAYADWIWQLMPEEERQTTISF
jgi:integrase